MVAMENGGAAVSQAQDRMAGLSVSNGGEPGPGAIVPVGKAQSVSLPAPDLSKVKQVDTHTRALGVIQPPPDLRAIIDKSAAFVAKNGVAFESKILEQQQGNPRFNFLRPNDPYHAYYKWKVADEAKGDKGAAPSTAAQQAQQAADIAAAAQPAVAPAEPAKPLEPPEPDQYSVRTPEGLTAEHLDIIKLTAQCVARNGQAFLTGLVSREQGNPTFLFLKPTHSLFGFFKELCDAYSRVLMPPKQLLGKLRADAADRTGLLERCLRRLEWEKAKEAQDKASADRLEAEREAMMAIDWHDFVVVETIDFFDDEDRELPPPMTQRDVVLLNRAGAFAAEPEEAAAAAAAPGAPPAPGQPPAGDVEMDTEERALLAEANAAEARQQAGVRVEADDDDEPMRIVKDYQRPAARAAGAAAAGMVVSPITGELVPLAQMAEHMRISLIDPQWKTQREAMLAKIRETTQASDEEISRNVLHLAANRPDVFGSTEEEVGAVVKASLDSRRISGNDRPLSWDGHTRAGEGLEQQMQAIEASKKRKEPEAGGAPAPVSGTSLPVVLPPPPRMNAPPVSLPPPPGKPPVLPPPAAATPAASGAPSSLPPPPAKPPTLPPPVLPAPALPKPPPASLPPSGLPPAPARPVPPPPGGAATAVPGPAPPQPPPVPEEPDPKRQRVEFVLQDEEEFLAANPGPSKVRVHCPDEPDNDSLSGQVLEVEVASLGTTIAELKARLAEVVSLPANKQQLSREHFRTLANTQTLAYYNVRPGVDLSLAVRKRGGR